MNSWNVAGPPDRSPPPEVRRPPERNPKKQAFREIAGAFSKAALPNGSAILLRG